MQRLGSLHCFRKFGWCHSTTVAPCRLLSAESAPAGRCALITVRGWCQSITVGPCWRLQCESAEAGRCTLASVLAWYISTRVAPCTLLSALDCYVFAAHRTQRRPAHKHKAKNKVCELDHVEIWEHRVCPRARNSNHHRTYGWCGPAEGPTVPEPSAACGIFKFNFFYG